jgi:hypothetical protein
MWIRSSFYDGRMKGEGRYDTVLGGKRVSETVEKEEG